MSAALYSDRSVFTVMVLASTPLIAGTSSVAHLRENLAVAGLALPADAVQALEQL